MMVDKLIDDAFTTRTNKELVIPEDNTFFMTPTCVLGLVSTDRRMKRALSDKEPYNFQGQLEFTSRTTFSRGYLQKILTLAKQLGADNITIDMGTDYPARFSIKSDDGAITQVILAPRISEETDEIDKLPMTFSEDEEKQEEQKERDG